MQVILFDLDGTLIDSTEAIVEGFEHAFRIHGLQAPARQEVCALVGHPLDVMFAGLGVEHFRVQECVEAYKAHYRAIFKPKTTLLPLAKEAIVLARSFATLGVVTTKTGHYSRELLEHLGVMKYFDVLIGREDVVHPKPHPEPIFKAMQGLGNPEATYWMVGDTCMDMTAACAAGVQGVAVTCGYGSEKSLYACSQHVTISPMHAVEKIMKLSKKETK